MHIYVETPKNDRKTIFRDKQTTNKVPQMFLEVQVITEK